MSAHDVEPDIVVRWLPRRGGPPRGTLLVGAYPNDFGAAGALLAMPMPRRLEFPHPHGAAFETGGSRSARACAAIRAMSDNHFVAEAAFSATFAWERERDEWSFRVYDADVDVSVVSAVTTPMREREWREPTQPVIEIALPYNLVVDEPCWVTLLPPFLHYDAMARPGLVLAGRWDLYAWPRPLNFAFEWHDWEIPLRIDRGEPLLYIRLDAAPPERTIAIVEAERTEWLDTFNTRYARRASDFGGSERQMREAHGLRRRHGLGPPRWLVPVRNGRQASAMEVGKRGRTVD